MRGPEHVTVDAEGRILTGTEDGHIWRLTLPYARRGLLRVDPRSRTVRTLADEVNGTPLRFRSNVTTAADGTVYFTVSSRRYALENWLGHILEHRGTDNCCGSSPAAVRKCCATGCSSPTEVALAPDESFVAVAESGDRRISRHWLTGPRTGKRDTLVNDLPGYPDNLTRGTDGVFWVALAGPREPAVSWLHHAATAVRRAAWATIKNLKPRPRPTVRVLAVRPDGRIVRHLLRHRSPYACTPETKDVNFHGTTDPALKRLG
ncbi:SMP-30/gluconolactonase/LRE family protein [Streptomyces sp. NPDC005962]|uniref:SMP-30/gluconolactonase/LRE family protein n=1 Tax=Streptomyces sp. NPDC005962 TaxID=3154466 RepID=UPI0033DABAB5